MILLKARVTSWVGQPILIQTSIVQDFFKVKMILFWILFF
jgi:hypothetical protein